MRAAEVWERENPHGRAPKGLCGLSQGGGIGAADDAGGSSDTGE